MKKTFYFIVGILFLQSVKSQVVFCPPGAEWHYSFYVQNYNSHWQNESIKHIGDTISGTDTIKVLEHKRFFKKFNDLVPNIPQPYTSIRQKGDTVFFRNISTNYKWQILYNFAALPGQSWQNTICIQPIRNAATLTLTNTYTITVDSIKNVVVNSNSLRRLYVKYTAIIYSQGWNLATNIDTTHIDERLGCNDFLFNFYERNFSNHYQEFFNGFLCYSDNSFGTIQFGAKPCDYVDALGINDKDNLNRSIKIYPQPANDFFIIALEDKLIKGLATLHMTDLCGREVKQINLENLSAESTRINISDLKNGAYILTLRNGSALIYTGKLLKVE